MCDLEVGPGAGDEVGDGEARLLAQPLAVAAHAPPLTRSLHEPATTSKPSRRKLRRHDAAGRPRYGMPSRGRALRAPAASRVTGRRRATPAARQHTDRMTRISAACCKAAGEGRGQQTDPTSHPAVPRRPQPPCPAPPRSLAVAAHYTCVHCTSDSDGSRLLRQPPTRAAPVRANRRSPPAAPQAKRLPCGGVRGPRRRRCGREHT